MLKQSYLNSALFEWTKLGLTNKKNSKAMRWIEMNSLDGFTNAFCFIISFSLWGSCCRLLVYILLCYNLVFYFFLWIMIHRICITEQVNGG